MYRHLDPAQIVKTVERLQVRIEERFPDSGLSRVALELLGVARAASERSAFIARRHFPLRVASGLIVLASITAIIAMLASFRLERDNLTWITLIQGVESGLNDVILLGAGLFFLITLETRIKRRRALDAIHELRSIAHVIDMHQLTKDPNALSGNAPTPHSPERRLSLHELSRYLDYCSEMLSLVGKIAALYVEKFDDSVALAAVDSIEDLTTGLSRKIWQKITLIEG